MALSTTNTITTTGYDTRTVIDRAYGALGLTPQQITGEKITIAQDLLSLVLTDLVNTANPLWCLEKLLVTLIQGQRAYTLLAGTNDVQSSFYRTMSNVSPAVFTNLPAAYLFDFGLLPDGVTPNSTPVSSWQIQWTGAAVPVTFQSSPDGVTWTTVYTSNFANSSGTGTMWYDMSITKAQRYWQVIPSTTFNGQTITPPNTLAITAASVYNTPADVMMYRMNRDDYFNMTNKVFEGRPLQFWLNRTLTPTIELWPQPDAGAALNLMVVRRQRLIMDVGSLQQQVEVPTRWFLTIIFALADQLAFCTPEAKPDRIQMVMQRYKEMKLWTWQEERDKAPIRFNANIRAYTR